MPKGCEASAQWAGRRSDSRSLVVVTEPNPEMCAQWDRLVETTPGTDVTQLSSWAHLRAHAGFDAIYIFARSADRLVAGAQILYRRLPGIGAVGYLPYGPLLGFGDNRSETCRLVADCLTELGRRRLRMLVVQPPEGAQDMSRELLGRGFRRSSADIAPAGSIRLDLTADLEEIRSGFHGRLRSWPNRWAGRGVRVRLGDVRDIPLLAQLTAHSARHQQYTPPSMDYLLAMYRELAVSDHAALFVGEVHGVPVAADMVTMCGEMIRGRVGGFDRSGEAARLSVPAAIRWEIIRWGQQRGYRWLDFGGLPEEVLRELVDGAPSDVESWRGFDRAKVAFGGTAFRYPLAVEMVGPAPVRLAYDQIARCAGGRRLLDAASELVRGRRPDQSRGARWRASRYPVDVVGDQRSRT